ncbi:MAG: hypothetical protein Kow002_11710 [Anaerolineales bacterium]
MSKTRIRELFTFLLFFTFACQGTWPLRPASQPATASTEFPASKLGSLERNITYCTIEGVELKLDAYYPASANGRWPALVYIHGGSWTGGDKRSPVTMPDRIALREAGFLVVSVNYRLAPEHQFPAMIEDVKCAVRYLRAKADQYNIDPERIGTWGTSAGGHLAALLGLADETAGWDVGPYLGHSSSVQAVAVFYGPTDLETLLQNNSERVFKNEDLALASPVNHVSKHAPPFLLLHGDRDRLVPLEQSEVLAEALTEHGARAELVIVQNGGHGFMPEDSPDMQPTREEITELLVRFFLRALR